MLSCRFFKQTFNDIAGCIVITCKSALSYDRKSVIFSD